jgi:dynein heavy chain
VSFKLIVLLKVLLTANRLTSEDVTLFLKGAAALDISSVRTKPFRWLSDPAWLNAVQLSVTNQLFRNVLEDLARNEGIWKAWYGDNEPEALPVPIYETLLSSDKNGTGPFLRLLLVRMLREDRTLIAVNEFIRSMEFIETGGLKLAAMGPKYVESVADTVDKLYAESHAFVPTIFLLSAGE